MKDQIVGEQTTLSDNLLSPEEKSICEKIAGGESPHSKRALALIALNDGRTQKEAANETGLSIGQVKYWLNKFRRLRSGIFPETVIGKESTEVDVALETASKGEITEMKTKVKKKKRRKKNAKAKLDKVTKKKKTLKKGTRKAKKIKKLKKKPGKRKKKETKKVKENKKLKKPKKKLRRSIKLKKGKKSKKSR